MGAALHGATRLLRHGPKLVPARTARGRKPDAVRPRAKKEAYKTTPTKDRIYQCEQDHNPLWWSSGSSRTDKKNGVRGQRDAERRGFSMSPFISLVWQIIRSCFLVGDGAAPYNPAINCFLMERRKSY